MFSVDIEVPREIGDRGQGQIAINDRPYIVQKITHQMILTATVPDQDGLYRIDWSLYQQRRFWKGSVPLADSAFGSVRHGIWQPLTSPLFLEANKTLHVTVENAATRTDPYVVQVLFHGVEDLRAARGATE